MSIRTFMCQRIMGSYIILGVSLRAPIGGSSDSSAYFMQYDTHSEFTPVADSASINARGDLRVVLIYHFELRVDTVIALREIVILPSSRLGTVLPGGTA